MFENETHGKNKNKLKTEHKITEEGNKFEWNKVERLEWGQKVGSRGIGNSGPSYPDVHRGLTPDWTQTCTPLLGNKRTKNK